MKRKPFDFLLFLGIVFVAANLRASITAVGPLVKSMRADLPFSSGVFGLLTTIPLIMFAVLSPFVRRISDRLGAGRTILYAGLVSALGIVLRSYAGSAGLFLGTVLIGGGVAIGNVLVPGIIKARFPERIGLATGAFTISMTSLAAVSAAVSYPISAIPGFGWRNSLAVWLALGAAAILIWLPQRNLSIVTPAALMAPEEDTAVSVWRSKTAWWLTALMGAQSFLFYFMAAWLPTIALTKGFTQESAGYLTFVFQLSTIPAAFVIPPVAMRMKDQRGLVSIGSAMYVCSFAFLTFLTSPVAITAAVILYGLSTGICFNLCLVLLSLRTRSAVRATSLSGMMQSMGYAFSAVAPVLGGWLFDLTGNWNAAIACAGALVVVLFVAGRQAGRDVFI